MDIEKYPLTNLSLDDLYDRLGEEAAEVAHAVFKRRRFPNNPHPRTGETGTERLFSEIADIKLVIAEVERRAGSSDDCADIHYLGF